MADGNEATPREIVETAVHGCFVRAGHDIEKAKRLFMVQLASHDSLREAVAAIEFSRYATESTHLRLKPSMNTEGRGHAVRASNGLSRSASPSVPKADDLGRYSDDRKVQRSVATSSAPNSDGRGPGLSASNGHKTPASPSLPPPCTAEQRATIEAIKSNSRRKSAQSAAETILYRLPDGTDIRTVAYRELFHYQQTCGAAAFVVSTIIRDYPQVDQSRRVGEFLPEASLKAIMAKAKEAVSNAFAQ